MTLLDLTENEIKLIIDHSLKVIPKPIEVFQEALASISGSKLHPTYVRSHFSECISTTEHSAYDKFLGYQKMAAKIVIEDFTKQYRGRIDNEPLPNVLEVFMPLAMEFEKRASQMRKSRAGTTFEMITKFLFDRAGVESEITARSIRKKLHRMDIVVPNLQVALKTPDRAAFLSLKHTLRERWKSSLPDKDRNWVMFMITLDNDIAEDKALDMGEHDVILYIKDEIKAKPHLARKDWIRRLSDLPGELKRFS